MIFECCHQFQWPTDIAVRPSDNSVFVLDGGELVRITNSGVVEKCLAENDSVYVYTRRCLIIICTNETLSVLTFKSTHFAG